MYIYIYIYGEIVNFVESDKMIKISEKVDKSNIYYGFSGNIPFFINRRTSLDSIFFAIFCILASEEINKQTENGFEHSYRIPIIFKRSN